MLIQVQVAGLQQFKGTCPDLPFVSHLLQLFQVRAKVNREI